MPLTVRLGPALDAALERYCIEHAVTKSRVVQESLASYLVNGAAAPVSSADAVSSRARAAALSRPEPSPAFRAFERAGLIGAGAIGAASADKAAVRRRITGG